MDISWRMGRSRFAEATRSAARQAVQSLVEVMNAAGSEQLSHLMTVRGTLGHEGKLGAGAGFEPATFRL